MAPEAAGNLVVLECKGPAVECQTHRFDPVKWDQPSVIHASFAATDPPPGYDSVAGGAVYVDRAGYQAKSYSAKLVRQGSWFAWRHPVHGNGLMMVVVLPPNQILPSVDDARPVFIESKVLTNGQLVLHWEVQDNARHEAEFAWRLQPTKATLEELQHHSALLNDESARRRQDPNYTKNVRASPFPSWATVAGAIFGGLTLLFFMGVVFATMAGHAISQSGRFPIIAVLALGVAMATAFLGGDAVAKGHLPVPFLKDNPIQFSVAGGIAVFVIVLLIGNAVFSPSPSDKPSTTTQQPKEEPSALPGGSKASPQIPAEPLISRENVCNFYGEASAGAAAWNKDEACVIPKAQYLDTTYRQTNFTCCGGGASSPTTSANIPAGLELIVDGGHYWSVQGPRLDSDRFSLHTYCGPEPAGGPGCNVKVQVWAHYRH